MWKQCKISTSKSVFNVTSLDFLSFLVSSDSIKLTSNNIELKSFLYPIHSKGLHKFLFMERFYWKLIPKFSEIVLPLSERIETIS